MTEIEAFKLGFRERLQSSGSFGRTWPDNQDLNEAYDSGMSFAEDLRLGWQSWGNGVPENSVFAVNPLAQEKTR